jgi:hypothetical protein
MLDSRLHVHPARITQKHRSAARPLPGCRDIDTAGFNSLSCCVRSPQKLFALARVFGNIPDDLFSRSYEAMIFRTVARAGMGPKLLVGAGFRV